MAATACGGATTTAELAWCGAFRKKLPVFLCAKRASPGLCWRNSPFHRGGDVMARPQTELLLQHLRRLAGPDAAAGSSDAELLRHFLGAGDEASFAALVRRHGAM